MEMINSTFRTIVILLCMNEARDIIEGKNTPIFTVSDQFLDWIMGTLKQDVCLERPMICHEPRTMVSPVVSTLNPGFKKRKSTQF